MKDDTEGIELVPVGGPYSIQELGRLAEKGAVDATKMSKNNRTFYVTMDNNNGDQFSVWSSNGLPAAYLSVRIDDSKTLATRTLEARIFNRPGRPSSPDDLEHHTQDLEPLQLGTDASGCPVLRVLPWVNLGS
jgi:hypothetical protein